MLESISARVGYRVNDRSVSLAAGRKSGLSKNFNIDVGQRLMIIK